MPKDLIPISKFYSIVSLLGFSVRTLQWYVTEKIIPEPIHEGKEAYYNLDECPIYDYLLIIKILKDYFSLPLKKIIRILDNYRNSNEDIIRLNNILSGFVEKYRINYLKFSDNARYYHHELDYDRVSRIKELLLEAIYAGKEMKTIDFSTIERTVEKERARRE